MKVIRNYPKKRPTAIDLFCGAGGLSLGFEQAGFDIVLGIDQDGHHIATHERNFPYGKSLCASVTDLNSEQILKLVGNREIDVVIGGPPCQGFSHMGLRDIADPRNTLVSHFARLVIGIKPKAFLMENVPGMGSGKTKAVLDDFLTQMEANGYKITKPLRVLDAADFGVPQSRRRLFVIGVREDIGRSISYPIGKCEGQSERPTVWEAIADLPTIETEDRLFQEDHTTYRKKPRSEYAAVARGIKNDPSDLSIPRIWATKTCTGCLRTKHAEASINLYAATPPGEVVPGHKLPRLHPDGIAPTLRLLISGDAAGGFIPNEYIGSARRIIHSHPDLDPNPSPKDYATIAQHIKAGGKGTIEIAVRDPITGQAMLQQISRKDVIAAYHYIGLYAAC